MTLSTPSAAMTQRLDRSSRTPAPMWPSVNSAANPSAIVTAVTAMRGECEKNRFGPPAPAIARPRKPAKLRKVTAASRGFVMARSFAKRDGCDAATHRQTPRSLPDSPSFPPGFELANRRRPDESLLGARDRPTAGPLGKEQSMRSDIEIARAARLKPIAEIAAKIGAPESALHPYGRSIAKLEYDFLRSLADRPDGKLILVSAINPTPAGEGKTTTTIGLGDALNRIGRKTIICLREPSLGPCFGLKGGATGGGRAQVAPMDEINLHFTGDFHAIASANNLLAAMVDNHMYWGNALGLDAAKIAWRRAMDMNDRPLRQITVGLGTKNQREDGFDIAVASEVM